MKLTKRFLALVLSLLFVASAFVGCNTGNTDNTGDTTTAEDIITTAPAQNVEITPDNIGEYTIIRSEEASETLRTAVATFRTNLGTAIGKNPKISDDWVKNVANLPESAKEIVIGTSNRPANDEIAKQICERDFVIIYKNERIYIMGGSDEKTLEALDYFFETYVDKNAKNIIVTDQLAYFSKHEYPVSKIEVNGVNLRDYTIVIPEKADLFTQYAALNLSNYVHANAGYPLTITTDKTSAVQYEILIGETNRSESKESVTLGKDQYALFTKNDKIVCLGDSYMVGGGAGAFAQMIKLDGKAAEIKIDNIPTTPKAETFTPKKAQSAVLMIGDGMGFNTVSMAEKALGYSFAAEVLPNLGSCVTASVNTQNDPTDPTDSAASATALATGYKTKDGYLGVNQSKSTIKNVRELAHEYGANTGVITTDVITGATPGGFLVHHSSRKDTEEIQAKIDSVVNGGKIDWCVGSIDKKLTENTAAAMRKLAYGGESFFIMIEGAQIDKRSHKNDVEGCVNMVERFNDAVAYMIEFVLFHPDTVLIVTADHECGGITEQPDGSFKYTLDDHSTADVPTYAIGYGTEMFNGQKIDNTDIPKFIAKIFGENGFGSNAANKR